MTTLSSLQATLAGEHAALFLYGDYGAHTSASAEPVLFELVSLLYRTHRGRRDQLRTMISDRAAVPVAAEATYEVPAEVTTAAAVRRDCIATEERCTEVYAALVANTAGSDRAWAIATLSESATARILLGGRPQLFPGAPDLRTAGGGARSRTE